MVHSAWLMTGAGRKTSRKFLSHSASDRYSDLGSDLSV